jgi:hypothetical protein
MCTVTFLPLGSKGFILTSNRDESPTRLPAQAPGRYRLHGQVLIFPRDPTGGGTWIATSGNGVSLCLLNGAFGAHQPSPPYRQSRGQVLLDFFAYDYAGEFATEYDFRGIEPFTLLVVRTEPALSLSEIRWDGQGVHLTAKGAGQPHIWSSATLYTPAVVRQREAWFADWLCDRDAFRVEDILHFHHFAGGDDAVNGLRMHRADGPQTVSITSIAQQGRGEHVMVYEDLVQRREQTYRIM